jgi:hypothetical protein
MHPINQEGKMAASDYPLAPDAETDIDSNEVHDVPLRDLETDEEVEELGPEEEELDENIERGDI